MRELHRRRRGKAAIPGRCLSATANRPRPHYGAFAHYTGDRPLVAYPLRYHLDQVLIPEWDQLGIGPIGTRGFCARRLAQRLLDPSPAGSVRLPALRRHYGLPGRGPYPALDDVETVIDLLARVLRPMAERRGLDSWQSVCAFTAREWYPARIGFGRFKGRRFREAETDGALHDWLVGLSRSSNPRNAAAGAWYLARLAERERAGRTRPREGAGAGPGEGPGALEAGIVIYTDPAVEGLRRRIAAARTRLAEVEAEYMNVRARVEFVEWKLYDLLRDRYRRRDRLARLVDHRRRYVEALLQDGEEEAESVAGAHERAQEDLDADYESLDRDAESRSEPTPEQEREIKALWRKLVKMYHPDRHAGEPEKRERYNRLIQAINQARDGGDVGILREIANDPEGFSRRQGWGRLDIGDDDAPDRLRQLCDGLEAQIVTLLDRLNGLRDSAAFDLYNRVEAAPETLDEFAGEEGAILDEEIAALEAEAEQLGTEIEELTGEPCQVVL